MSGRGFPTQLPRLPETGFADLDGAQRQYEAMREKWSSARAQLKDLQGRRPAAADDDEQAFADALRAGGKDPGKKETERLEAEIERTTRELNAAARAIEDAAAMLFRSVGAHRAELTGRYRAQLADAREGWESLVSQVEERLQQLTELDGAARLVARWPEKAPRPRRTITVDGTTVKLRSLVAALDAFCEPAAPIAEPATYDLDGAAERLGVTPPRVVKYLDAGRIEGTSTYAQIGEHRRRVFELDGPSVRALADELTEARYLRPA